MDFTMDIHNGAIGAAFALKNLLVLGSFCPYRESAVNKKKEILAFHAEAIYIYISSAVTVKLSYSIPKSDVKKAISKEPEDRTPTSRIPFLGYTHKDQRMMQNQIPGRE